VVQRRGNKHGRFIELSEHGRGGRRSFVVIPEGSDGKGWLDCWVLMQRLKGYNDKQCQGRKTKGKQIVVAPTVTSLRGDGRSYAVAFGASREISMW
jgi:hypothetical protein